MFYKVNAARYGSSELSGKKHIFQYHITIWYIQRLLYHSETLASDQFSNNYDLQ